MSYSSYEKEYRDQEEYERIKEMRVKQQQQKQQQQHRTVENSDGNMTTENGEENNRKDIARVEYDYEVSVTQWVTITSVRTQGHTILYCGRDDSPTEREVIASAKETVIEMCQAKIKQMSEANAGRRITEDPPRPTLEGTFRILLAESGRMVHCKLKLGAQCDEVAQ